MVLRSFAVLIDRLKLSGQSSEYSLTYFQIVLESSNGPITTINTLPDNVFVAIFSFCRMDEVDKKRHLTWNWHRLTHVCRAWRYIIFASSRHLHLELFCTHGTPVKKTLRYLPALPIVISFVEMPWGRKNKDKINLFSALKHHDRIRVIDLRVPDALFEELAVVMRKPFPALTYLGLKTADKLILPDTFPTGSAPRLQQICFDGIPFPAAPNLLWLAHDLVNVDLRNIPSASYIPPEVIVGSLATLPRLEDLAFGFQWGTSYPDRIPLPVPSNPRTVLPALTTVLFEGLREYFEHLVVQIDAPQLDCLRIDFFDQQEDQQDTDFRIPQLRKFIDRSEKFKLSRLRRAHLLIADYDVTMNLLDRDWSSFRLQVIMDPGVAIGQVVNQLSAIFSNVDHLSIIPDIPMSTGIGTLGRGIRWLELFRPFTAVKALYVHGKISWIILLALTEERAAEILPALELLFLEGKPLASLEAFLAVRQSVGRPVTVVNEEREFQERVNILDVGE